MEDNILVEVLDNILAEVVDSILEVAVDMEAVEEEVDEPEVLDDAHDAPPPVEVHVAAQRKKQ